MRRSPSAGLLSVALTTPSRSAPPRPVPPCPRRCRASRRSSPQPCTAWPSSSCPTRDSTRQQLLRRPPSPAPAPAPGLLEVARRLVADYHTNDWERSPTLPLKSQSQSRTPTPAPSPGSRSEFQIVKSTHFEVLFFQEHGRPVRRRRKPTRSAHGGARGTCAF